MKYMPMGSYIEGNSPIHRMDAFVKLLFTFVLFAAVILSDTVVGYGFVIAFIAVTVRIAGIGWRNALNGVRQMWLFFVVILLMNAVFYEGTQPLWSWWVLSLSWEGIIQGCHVVLRVVLAMLLGNLLVSTTSPLEIVKAIEKLLHPLRCLGVPVRDVAMILGVAIQFIPIFMEEADMIQKAQTARGARFESKNLLEKAGSVIPLVVPIFLAAFRRADELAVAMEARGYHRSKTK